MKGYKMVKDDYTAFFDGKTMYKVGKKVTVIPNDSQPPHSQGMTVSKESHNPLKFNARYPWRLIEVSFQKKNIIQELDDRYVVSELKVMKEMEPWNIDLPNAKRVYDKIASASKIKLQCQTEARKKKIETLVKQHVSGLNRMSGRQEIILNGIKFYSIKEWASVRDSVWASVRDSVWDSVGDSVWDSVRDSVWDSVWDSVRASVWDSVWDSVWASVGDSVWDSVRDSVWASVIHKDASNPFLPLQRICETGGVFYGIDKEGIAHVTMPSNDEIAEVD